MNARNFKRVLGMMAAVILLGMGGGAWAQKLPAGMSIPEDTLSPNHHYGILVPQMAEEDHIKDPHNKLVEAKTGKVIAVINAEPGFDHMNHGGALPPVWAKDNSAVLWQVDGKWSPRALVLLTLEKGASKVQVDLLKTGQQEILARVRKAEPKKYTTIKTAHAKGYGSAYPDGFTVNVGAVGGGDDLTFPVKLQVDLTSDPKGAEPELPHLNAFLNAEVDAAGNFKVTKFSMGNRPE